jgi:hypothetical protein
MKQFGRNLGFVLALATSLPVAGWLNSLTHADETTGASSGSASTAAKKSTPAKPVQTQSAQTKPTRKRPAQTAPAQKKSASAKSPQTQQAPLVFTDEDLKKYRSGASTQPARNVVAPAETPDPLKAIKDEQERALWRQKRTAELQQKVLDLEARLKGLEQRRLSIQNPLLPRTPGPEGTAEQEIGLSGPELLARTDEEIQHTTRQLEAARKDLATFLEKKPE